MGNIWLATVKLQEKVKYHTETSSHHLKEASIWPVILIILTKKERGIGHHFWRTQILQMHNEMMVQVKNGMAKDGMDFWHVKFFFHL